MSMDSSLKTKGALSRHRNVLSRAERIEQLKLEERWEEGDDVTGLVKVAHRKAHAGRKDAKEEVAAEGVEGVEGAEGAEVTAAAPGTES